MAVVSSVDRAGGSERVARSVTPERCRHGQNGIRCTESDSEPLQLSGYSGTHGRSTTTVTDIQQSRMAATDPYNPHNIIEGNRNNLAIFGFKLMCDGQQDYYFVRVFKKPFLLAMGRITMDGVSLSDVPRA